MMTRHRTAILTWQAASPTSPIEVSDCILCGDVNTKCETAKPTSRASSAFPTSLPQSPLVPNAADTRCHHLLNDFARRFEGLKEQYRVTGPPSALSQVEKEELLRELWRISEQLCASSTASKTTDSAPLPPSYSWSPRAAVASMSYPHSPAWPSSVASLIEPQPTFESYNAEFEVDAFGNETLNQYTILGELGKGSFSAVDLAEHRETNRLVAIKSMRRSILRRFDRTRGGGLERVMTEIAIMKKLRHKHVVQLFEVIDDPKADRLFLVLQYVARGPIVKMQDDGSCQRLGRESLLRCIRQCATGLQYLHRHNIVHRDIKPDNILVDADDNVYLSDFGVSSAFDDEGAMRRTEGTPLFFSPEICRGESHLHPYTSDVWAFGVTLYALAFGHLPFQLPSARTVSAVFDCIHNAPLEFPPEAPVLLQDLLRSMLNRDPTRRATLEQIKGHPWLREAGASPVPQESPVTVTPLEVAQSLQRCDASKLTLWATKTQPALARHMVSRRLSGKTIRIVQRFVSSVRQRLSKPPVMPHLSTHHTSMPLPPPTVSLAPFRRIPFT